MFSEAASPPYYPGVVRSPGYPAFLSAVYWLGGEREIAVQIAQLVLPAALAVLVGCIGRALAGRVVGTVAAVLCATYLPFLEFTTHFLTEILGSFCLIVFVAVLLRARRADSPALYAGSGLSLAALSYVRPEFLLLAVPISLILLAGSTGSWLSPGRWGAVLAFSCAFIVALVPWTVRNAIVTGGDVLPMAATSGSDLLASADQYRGLISYKFTPADWRRYEAQARFGRAGGQRQLPVRPPGLGRSRPGAI